MAVLRTRGGAVDTNARVRHTEGRRRTEAVYPVLVYQWGEDSQQKPRGACRAVGKTDVGRA